MEKLTYYYWQFKVEHISIGVVADDYEIAKANINFLFPKMAKSVNLELVSVNENWLPGIAFKDMTTTMAKVLESEK